MDLYVLMADPGNVITLDDRVVRVDEAMREVRDVLRRGGLAVVDEFQRLPEVYWSMISNWARQWGFGGRGFKLRHSQQGV